MYTLSSTHPMVSVVPDLVGSCGGFSNEAKDEKEAKDQKANSAHCYAYPSHCYLAACRSGNFTRKDSIANRGT